MSQISSFFGNLPGMGSVTESFDAQTFWGIQAQLTIIGGEIASTAADPTNSPTWRLRPGLVLGRIAASNQWVNYSATATDGSQNAQGILGIPLRMQDVLTGSNTPKYQPIVVGGNVKSALLVGLDANARIQLAANFKFDDQFTTYPNGAYWGPAGRYVTKTADYTVVAADAFTEFNTLGALGAVNFTLPAIANGLVFRFRNMADQNMTVTSAEGSNVVALNNLTASSVAFSTGSGKIGGGVMVYSNPAGTKWIVQNISAGANTITVA
jgi:hypothetical protein